MYRYFDFEQNKKSNLTFFSKHKALKPFVIHDVNHSLFVKRITLAVISCLDDTEQRQGHDGYFLGLSAAEVV